MNTFEIYRFFVASVYKFILCANYVYFTAKSLCARLTIRNVWFIMEIFRCNFGVNEDVLCE